MNRKEHVVLIGTFMNVFLAVFKFAAGAVTGSIGLIADGIHSSSDIVASIALYLGVKLSARKTKVFPFGMYKLENLVSLFTSFAIFFAGYEILKEILFSKTSYELKHLWVAILVEIAAILTTYLFSKYEFQIGRIEESPGLIADSHHVRSDMLSSIIIIVGLTGASFHLQYLDKVAAVIVALLIFKAGYGVALDSIKVLLDASVDYKTLDEMRKIIGRSPFVKEIKEINGRNSGSYKFLEAIITLKTKNLDKAHKVVSQIETEIKKGIPHVDSVIIHYEPAEKKEINAAVPIETPETVSDDFGSAPYFLFLKINNKKIIGEEILSNLHKNVSKGKGIKTAEWLAKKGADIIFLKNNIKSDGPKYLFDDYDISIIVIPNITIRKIKEILINGQN